MSENQIIEACLRCQIGTLNGMRGEQLIANCDKSSCLLLKRIADVKEAA